MSMFNKIVEYASRQLEIPAEEITRDTTFESLGVDSLDIVEMTMDFEAELGVELDMEGMNISTFGELADYMDDRLS
ncbi:MAG: acyl carrier protein [Oscillospiraceae bacterium]|jgi:acyl carrier protein